MYKLTWESLCLTVALCPWGQDACSCCKFLAVHVEHPSWGLVANKGDLQVLVGLYVYRLAHFYVADIDALE